MGCADYRLYCDGDSDGDGNGILYRVLNKKRAFWNDFPGRFVFSLYVVMGCYFTLGLNLPRATGAAICDKAATRRQNRVAKQFKIEIEVNII